MRRHGALAIRIATVFAALSATGPAVAASYDVTVRIETWSVDRLTTDGPSATGVQADDFEASTYPFGGATSVLEAEAFASAFPGELAGRSRVYFSLPVGAGAGVVLDQNYASARLVIDDLVISGPPGNVSFRVNVEVIGSVSIRQEGLTTAATASAYVRGDLDSSLGPTTGWTFGSMNVCQRGAGALGFECAAAFQGTGMFANWMGTGIGSSPELTAPVGEALRLELELDTDAYVFAYQGGEPLALAEADSDFAGAVRFPSSIPVLTLPQGYSAYSATGGIAVPEPGPIAGSCVAQLAMLFCLRRRLSAGGTS
jgi:hypothetical protein